MSKQQTLGFIYLCWMCRNHVKATDSSSHLRMQIVLRKLSGADPEGRRHCIKLLRTFDYRGHLCMAFEAMVCLSAACAVLTLLQLCPVKLSPQALQGSMLVNCVSNTSVPSVIHFAETHHWLQWILCHEHISPLLCVRVCTHICPRDFCGVEMSACLLASFHYCSSACAWYCTCCWANLAHSRDTTYTAHGLQKTHHPYVMIAGHQPARADQEVWPGHWSQHCSGVQVLSPDVDLPVPPAQLWSPAR